jgi:hypothetical protein
MDEALRNADSKDGLALKFRLSAGASEAHDPYADVHGGGSFVGAFVNATQPSNGPASPAASAPGSSSSTPPGYTPAEDPYAT